MIAELQCVVLDCADPLTLAHFYASLAGGEVNRPDRRWGVDDDWATLHTPNGLVLAFQRVPDHRPPRWPDPAHPQQFHMDFSVPDLLHAHAQMLELGASLLLDDGAGARSWRIYADPAGHPFCLVRH
ncbi:VOC family protein [Streptomyces sp. ISL-96]|uniref:VOC family protein n=1 Tax=unclassified Streptomyces TaxID=2593676 RepID=UPI001BE61862|nr:MULTISPECIES: VOC family protein [unclassified Streptomyces]MBT2401742.1 VOC family protein [Streptomyces sp. ISL-100]MBT2486995.1 VOC family protein [Streptomyces sp. ISL-96]